ncbi:MAG TPA: glycerophosphodiester phosphodiesterase [Actinomycetota bacterium]|nr:glycerophosphodiester phosphodiesterase [Actinomycetota bacterium]
MVVAHRGASAQEPENTVAAFEAAVAAGADAVELDVRLTADGIPVVLHDPDVASTTDGRGPVHALTLAEVKRLDASGGRGPRQEVPTLAEALDVLGRHAGVAVDLEIKNIPGEPAFDSPDEAILNATLRTLEASGFGGPVLVSSFNWITIERCKEVAPELPTGFLTIAAMEPRAALVYARQRGHDFILPQSSALLAAGDPLVEEAHREGIRVGTWTVDDRGDLATLFGWGVDAVASNVPALAVAVRDGGAGQR